MLPCVLSVGQCSYDDTRITEMLRRAGARMESAESAHEAIEMIAKNDYRLILINRILEDGESGIALIKELKFQRILIPVMLVSNFPDSQDEAVALGALRGFGKYVLQDDRTAASIKNALAATVSRT